MVVYFNGVNSEKSATGLRFLSTEVYLLPAELSIDSPFFSAVLLRSVGAPSLSILLTEYALPTLLRVYGVDKNRLDPPEGDKQRKSAFDGDRILIFKMLRSGLCAVLRIGGLELLVADFLVDLKTEAALFRFFIIRVSGAGTGSAGLRFVFSTYFSRLPLPL